MAKSFSKSKSEPNAPGPGFRTPSFFRGNQFGKNIRPGGGPKFNPGTFKTQHKG